MPESVHVSIPQQRKNAASLMCCAGTVTPLPHVLSPAAATSSLSDSQNVASQTEPHTNNQTLSPATRLEAFTLHLGAVRTAEDYRHHAHALAHLLTCKEVDKEELARRMLAHGQTLVKEGAPDTALLVAHDALGVIRRVGSTDRILEAELLICIARAGLERFWDDSFADSVEFLKEAVDLLDGTQPEIALSALTDAMRLTAHGVDPRTKLECLSLAQQVCRSAGISYHPQLCEFTCEKIDFYIVQHNWRMALLEIERFQEEQGGEAEIPAHFAVTLDARKARVFRAEGKFENAYRVARRAATREVSTEHSTPLLLAARTLAYEVLGALEVSANDFESAATFFDQALAVERSQSQPDVNVLRRITFRLANVHARRWDRNAEERAYYALEADLKRYEMWDGGFGLELLEKHATLAARDGLFDRLSERVAACEKHLLDVHVGPSFDYAVRLLTLGQLLAGSERDEDLIRAQDLLLRGIETIKNVREAPGPFIDALFTCVLLAAERDDREAAVNWAAKMHAVAHECSDDGTEPILGVHLSLASAYWDNDMRIEARKELRAARHLIQEVSPVLLGARSEYFLILGAMQLTQDEGSDIAQNDSILRPENAQRALRYFRRSFKYHRLALAAGEGGLSEGRLCELYDHLGHTYAELWDSTSDESARRKAIHFLRSEELLMRRNYRDRGQHYAEMLDTIIHLHEATPARRPDDYADLKQYRERHQALERERRLHDGSDIDLE